MTYIHFFIYLFMYFLFCVHLCILVFFIYVQCIYLSIDFSPSILPPLFSTMWRPRCVGTKDVDSPVQVQMCRVSESPPPCFTVLHTISIVSRSKYKKQISFCVSRGARGSDMWMCEASALQWACIFTNRVIYNLQRLMLWQLIRKKGLHKLHYTLWMCCNRFASTQCSLLPPAVCGAHCSFSGVT